jgi:hypothetical protein
MKPSENIENLIKDMPINTNPKKDREVLDDVMNAMEESKKEPSIKINTWRVIMQNRITKFGSAAAVLMILIYVLFGNSGRTAWAFEQAIEAVKNYKAVYMEGTIPDGSFECWVRSDDTGTQSKDFVVKTSNGIIAWVKDGSTYAYVPQENNVYYEDAVTSGFSQWLGPELLEMLASMKSTRVLYGRDPETGRQRVTVMSSLFDATGPKSFVIEFDSETKLAVSMKQWDNMDMSGRPAFSAAKIIYYKDLTDGLFNVNIPGNVKYVEKPLTIPEENIGLLSNPNDGIPAEGLSGQEACEKILTDMWDAIIAGDIDTIKRLCPVCANLDDEFILQFIIRTGKGNQIVELVSIGKISKEGQTKLGTIAAVPVISKCKDGTKMEDKMIVQFRNFAGGPSCVIHGPYGISQQVN